MNVIGDNDLDLLILPVVTMTLVVGQALQACMKWLTHQVHLDRRTS